MSISSVSCAASRAVRRARARRLPRWSSSPKIGCLSFLLPASLHRKSYACSSTFAGRSSLPTLIERVGNSRWIVQLPRELGDFTRATIHFIYGAPNHALVSQVATVGRDRRTAAIARRVLREQLGVLHRQLLEIARHDEVCRRDIYRPPDSGSISGRAGLPCGRRFASTQRSAVRRPSGPPETLISSVTFRLLPSKLKTESEFSTMFCASKVLPSRLQPTP